jgi:PAS domain S-box-containing protein
MINRNISDQINAQNTLIIALKLITIVGVSEFLIKIFLINAGPFSSSIELVLEGGFLTFLSGISIFFFLILPEKKRIEEEYKSFMYTIGQEIFAIDNIAIITATDEYGKIIYANDKFCQISGYAREELYGKDHRIVNSGYHPKHFFEEMWKTILSGKSWHGRVCNISKYGNIYWVQAYVVPIFDEKGKLEKYVSFRFDITDQILAQAALDSANKIL